MRHFIPCVALEADELARRFITAVYSLHGLPENSQWQPRDSVILDKVCKDSNILLKESVCYLGLTISLRMEGRRRLQSYV